MKKSYKIVKGNMYTSTISGDDFIAMETKESNFAHDYVDMIRCGSRTGAEVHVDCRIGFLQLC